MTETAKAFIERHDELRPLLSYADDFKVVTDFRIDSRNVPQVYGLMFCGVDKQRNTLFSVTLPWLTDHDVGDSDAYLRFLRYGLGELLHKAQKESAA